MNVKKQVFRSLVFLSLLLLLLLAAGRIFRPKNNDAQSGIHDVLASGYLSEPEDTLDVIFLGDSLVHTSFIPMRAWENHGITAHICATNGQAVYKSEEFLYSVLQTQHPAVVMLEAHHLYKNFAWTDLIAPTAERLLPVLRYHSRWKSLNSGDLLSPVAYTAEIYEKGYYFTAEIRPVEPGDYMEPREGTDPISHMAVDYVRHMQRLCQESGAELVLYSVPSSMNWNSVKHQTVAALAEALDIPYLDMNLLPQEVPIDWSVDSKDAGDHMNYTGACKVTDYLSAWLVQEYNLTDKRGLPEYAQWDTLLPRFRQFVRENM